MEVNNGGFDQYFFNSPGDRVIQALAALETVGAGKTADILRRAMAKFPDGEIPSDRDQRQELLEQVSLDTDAFEEEDEAFLEYQDDLTSLIEAYVG
ncbi:DMP19 family protein [Atopomonas hussainii]|uniref:DMP19 family protein n=1 Tax=Atopomonas hussainii TaxID=1429083 RepID=UPI0009F80887|nr:DUF4375 domain-containing protein [Atopomonas hussainii]